jgi:hypothetical protein
LKGGMERLGIADIFSPAGCDPYDRNTLPG